MKLASTAALLAMMAMSADARKPTHSPSVSSSRAPTPTASPSKGITPTIVIDQFPAKETLGIVTGHVTNLGTPSNYVVVLYVQASDGSYWIKPGPVSPNPPGPAVQLNATGHFSYNQWYINSPPTDWQFVNLRFQVFPVGTAVPQPLGASLISAPPSPIADASFPTGYQPNGGVFISTTEFPAPGGLGTVAGVVENLAHPQNYQIIFYVQASNGHWWLKPTISPPSAYAIGSDGSFSINNWATNPSTDTSIMSILLFVVPNTTPIQVAQDQVAQPDYSGEIVYALYERGYAISRRLRQ